MIWSSFLCYAYITLLLDNQLRHGILAKVYNSNSTEVPEIEDAQGSKLLAPPPPYSPNAWVKLADFFARDPSWGYFQGHRGDF